MIFAISAFSDAAGVSYAWSVKELEHYNGQSVGIIYFFYITFSLTYHFICSRLKHYSFVQYFG